MIPRCRLLISEPRRQRFRAKKFSLIQRVPDIRIVRCFPAKLI